eukprot:4177221-Alexandrium_andersonii.AAC.1
MSSMSWRRLLNAANSRKPSQGGAFPSRARASWTLAGFGPCARKPKSAMKRFSKTLSRSALG